jgi:hypothetical protein
MDAAHHNTPLTPPDNAPSTRQLKSRRPANRISDTERRDSQRRVAAEVITLVYEKYCAHLLRGCSREQCVVHGSVKICIDSLACPVATRTSPLYAPHPHKMLVASDLSRLAVEVATAHNLPQPSNRIVTIIRRIDKDITAFKPAITSQSYPCKSTHRAWAVTSWSELALQLAAVSPTHKFRLLAASDRIQRFAEINGTITAAANAVLRRLCTAAGVPISSDPLSIHQMIQLARHHSLKQFEPELDRIRYHQANSHI